MISCPCSCGSFPDVPLHNLVHGHECVVTNRLARAIGPLNIFSPHINMMPWASWQDRTLSPLRGHELDLMDFGFSNKEDGELGLALISLLSCRRVLERWWALLHLTPVSTFTI